MRDIMLSVIKIAIQRGFTVHRIRFQESKRMLFVLKHKTVL